MLDNKPKKDGALADVLGRESRREKKESLHGWFELTLVPW